MYRVAQQCCPGGNRPETPPPGDPCNNSYCAVGGPRNENRPEISRKTLLGTPKGVLGGRGLRTISAGTSMLVHTVCCRYVVE